MRRRPFVLAATALRGCAALATEQSFSCLGGAFALRLAPRAPQAVGPGWIRLEVQFEAMGAGCTELALEAEGAALPPHSLRTTLHANGAGNVWHANYFLAPGTERLTLVGRAGRNTALVLQGIFGHEQGSHEAGLRERATSWLARLSDVDHIKHDVRRLAGCVRRGDWQKLARAIRRRGGPVLQRNGYEAWVARHDTLTTTEVAAMEAWQVAVADPPHISLIVPCYNTPAEMLLECIASVEQQIYPHWQLCLSNDASTEPHVREILDAAAQRDPRIVVTHAARNGHISRASNAAIAMAQHPWLGLLDHDDTLAPHALHLMAKAIVQHPQAELLYSDEDKLDEYGRRLDPYFKPAWNPDLLRSQNYVSHFGVYRKALVDAVGGFRPAFDGSQDYDLVLRVTERLQPHQIVHVPHVLYHWRMLPGSAATGTESKPYAYVAAQLALTEHFARTGHDAQVRPSIYPGLYHVKYAVPKAAPKVSIVIPTRDNVKVLDRCIETLRDHTHYGNYEIVVVDNDSREARSQAYMEQLRKKPNVRCLAYDYPFNYAAINNWAVAQCDGELLCLLNDDVEILHGDWLEEMVGHALRGEVGAVGAKLLFPNRTVQHGGVTLGVGGIAAHAFRGVGQKDPAYFGRAVLAHNVTAVTAACMVLRRAVWQQAQGFNERLAVAYNDVDLCLRLYLMGYDNVFTPHAQLLHHESYSRGPDLLDGRPGFREEWRWMAKRYKDIIAQDPNYNPNLTFDREDYSKAEEPRHRPRYALRPDLGRMQAWRPLAAKLAAGAEMAPPRQAAVPPSRSTGPAKGRMPPRHAESTPAHLRQ